MTKERVREQLGQSHYMKMEPREPTTSRLPVWYPKRQHHRATLLVGNRYNSRNWRNRAIMTLRQHTYNSGKKCAVEINRATNERNVMANVMDRAASKGLSH